MTESGCGIIYYNTIIARIGAQPVFEVETFSISLTTTIQNVLQTWLFSQVIRVIPRGIVFNVLDCNIVESESKL